VSPGQGSFSPSGASEGTYSVGFSLFILVNAVLFLRPAEIIPDVVGWPIYEVVILCCLAVSLPDWIRQLAPGALGNQPITVCVLGILAMVIVSFLGQSALWSARVYGFDFSKVVLY
jgi:hypothetical protein